MSSCRRRPPWRKLRVKALYFSDAQMRIVQEVAATVPYDLRERYLLSLADDLSWRARPLLDADVIAAATRASTLWRVHDAH
jgi:hypothetical protein